MQIRNLRPDDVEIAAVAFGFEAVVEANGVIDVPDEVGASLLEQPANWAAVAAPSKKEL